MFVFIVNALSLELGMMSFGTLDIYTKGKEGRKEERKWGCFYHGGNWKVYYLGIVSDFMISGLWSNEFLFQVLVMSKLLDELKLGMLKIGFV